MRNRSGTFSVREIVSFEYVFVQGRQMPSNTSKADHTTQLRASLHHCQNTFQISLARTFLLHRFASLLSFSPSVCGRHT